MTATQSLYYVLSISLFLLSLLVFAAMAHAGGAIGKLTQANVTDFIETTTDLTSGNSEDLSSEKVREYLDKHLEDEAIFKSLMRFNIPNMPPQETNLNLDKAKFMQSVNEGASAVDSYENLIEIKQVKIASNGKKAFVKTESTEYANMSVPTETGDSEDVPVEGISKCTQILSLNDGVIQVYSANCVTEIQFLEY